MLIRRISSYTGVCKSHTQVVSVISPSHSRAAVQPVFNNCIFYVRLAERRFLPKVLQTKTYKRNNLLVLCAVRVEIWGVREHGAEVITKETKWLEYMTINVIRGFVNVFSKRY
jgi:hypothetical protein